MTAKTLEMWDGEVTPGHAIDMNTGAPPLKDSDVLDFGRFEDTKIGDVPAWYLLLIVEQEWTQQNRPALCAYVKENRNYLEAEKRQENSKRYR